MAAMNPKAVNTGRGAHPDLDENGDVRQDPLAGMSRDERINVLSQDPEWRAQHHAQIAHWQSGRHPDVQRMVGGRQYAPYGTYAEGMREYSADVQFWDQQLGVRYREDLDAHQDEILDERGRVKPGVVYHDRGAVALNDSLDPFSASEFAAETSRHRARREQP